DFLDATEQQLGPLDVLVNNAGIMQVGRFIDEDDVTARRMIDINLHGVILGTKLALDRMVPRDRGHIVNISSQAGKFGTPGGATYSATKHAVVGLTEAVRGELRLMGAHVDVSYVMPAIVNTELGSGLVEVRGIKKLQPTEVAEAIVEALEQRIVDVWVPKSSKRTSAMATLMPRALVRWALVVSLALGLRNADFPGSLGGQRLVSAITAALVLAAVSTAVITSGGEGKTEAAAATSTSASKQPAPAPATSTEPAPA